MGTYRSVLAALSLGVVILGLTAPASAQYQGRFPRTASPNTWSHENDGNPCPSQGATTTRTFEVFQFSVTAAGTYNVTATRTGGGFIAMDFYQGAFTPTFPCANFISSTQGTNSVSMSFPVCSSGCVDPLWVMYVVISGASGTDVGDFTVNITGPGSTVALCNSAGTITPTSQAVASAGGSFSATYTPSSEPSCRSWTSSNVPAWITGVPASGDGPVTFTVNAAANTGASRNAQLRFGRDNANPWADWLSQLTVTQPASTCTYSVPAGPSNVGSGAGTGSFAITAGAGCAWSASSSAPSWLTSSSSGSGNGTASFSYAANTGPARSGTVNVGGQTHTVSQASGCTTTLTSSSGSVGAGAGSANVPLTRSNGSCAYAWTASTSTPWITLSAASGSTSSVGYSVTANTGPARTGTITVNGATYTVTQATGCVATFSPTAGSVGAGASSSSVTATLSNPACTWTASSNAAWITGVPAGSFTGSSAVSFNVAQNTGPSRSGTLTINGQAYTVTQASGCTAMLSASTRNVGAASGADAITVTLSNAACPWTSTPTSTSPWVTSYTLSGTGTASFSFSFAQNPGVARTATFTVAGQPFSVTQANGCVSSLPVAGETVPAAGGNETALLNMSSTTCPWTASTTTPWITVNTPSGMGSTNVSYSFATNVGPQRVGTILLDGQTFTVTQQTGCAATFAQPTSTVSAAGGTGTVAFTVTDQACAWTAASSAPFLSITSPTTGTGNGSISYSVPAHQGPQRAASLGVFGATHTVTQASGCAIALSPMSASASAAGGTTTFSVMTEPGCTWDASTTDAFITSVTPSGVGPGTITVAYAANPGVARTGTVSVVSTSSPSQADFTLGQADGCVAMLGSTSANVAAGGISASVSLTMSDAACPWTASSSQPFAAVATASGAGSASVGYTVDPHDGPARQAVLTIAGLAFTIQQASGCAIALTPTSANVSEASGSTTFMVDTAAGCAWTTSESLSWVTGVIASGAGPGAVTVDYAANASITRNGNVRTTSTDTGVFADFALTQGDGCTATLDPTTASAASASASLAVDVTLSDAACPWTAASSEPWLTVADTSGTGSATVNYDVVANVGPERTATVTIAGETLTVTQASGCVIDITPTSAGVSQAAGTTSFDVTTAAGCTYDVTNAAPWFTSVPLTGTGPGTLSFGYQANTGVERVGELTLTTDTGDAESFALTQADGCVVTLPVAEADVVAAGGTSDFVVDMGAGCGYTAASDATWLTATVTATGVEYQASAWDGAARTATITVTSTTSASAEVFTVTQASGCVVMLSPGSLSLDGGGGTVTFEVQTAAGCTFTASSVDDFIANVTVSGNTVSFEIAENGRVPRTGMVVVNADMTDSSGTFVVEQGEGDGRPGDAGVATGVVPIGQGCSASPASHTGSPLGCLLFGLAMLLVRRRSRALWLLPLLVLLGAASSADAQAFAEGYDLARHRPATSARLDYGTVESGESRLDGHFELGATLGYDIRPLVVTTTTNEDARAVAGQLWMRVTGSFALGQRFRLSAQMPFVLARHGDMAVLPDYPDVDRAAVGDLLLVPKFTLVTRPAEDGELFGHGVALALLVPVSFPTGQAGRLAGEGFTVEPRVALDVGSRTGLGVALNAGFRIREARQVLGNELDEEVTLGLAARVPVGSPRLFAIGEVVTDIAVRTDTRRNASRGEVLASLRYAGESVVVSGGVGAGILGGLATPRFRIFASVAYAPGGRTPVEPEPASQPEPEAAPEPEPEPEVAQVEPEVAEPEPEAAPEPEPQPEAVAQTEPTPAVDAPRAPRCEANPAAPGCARTALCGTDAARAARDEAGLETIAEFEYDSAELPPQANEAIARMATRLQENDGIGQVIIVGHADPNGSPAHNDALSRARATAVVDALVRAGVSRQRLVLRGAGSRCASEGVPDSANRRVEALIVMPR